MGCRVRHLCAEFVEHTCDYCTDGNRTNMRPHIDHDRLRDCTLTVGQLAEAARVLGFDLEIRVSPRSDPKADDAPRSPTVLPTADRMSW